MLLQQLEIDLPPNELYRRLERRLGHTFLLESMEGPERLARYSIMGFNPHGSLRLHKGHIQVVGDLPIADGDERPGAYLRRVLHDTIERHDRPTGADLMVPFNGGLVGYFGYDYVRYVEQLPDTQDDDEGWPETAFGLYLDGLVFDHRKRTLNYFSHTDDRSEAVFRAVSSPVRDPAPLEIDELTANMDQGTFEDAVRKLQHHIREGDIFQAVLSRRLSAEYRGDLSLLYEALRENNPSPYMYQIDLGERRIIGSSPEMLVRVETDAWRYRRGTVHDAADLPRDLLVPIDPTGDPDGATHGFRLIDDIGDGQATAETFPIAGTRPLGQTEAETAALARDLLADPKEIAEHEMLVDLARNDLGRVARFGTVNVPDHRTIERYSHVQHIVSRVRARLQKGKDAIDAFEAVFPAGTVSGAPKVRAMEILEGLEPTRRGPYAGAVGYLSLNGNMDTAITIRTLTATHRRVSIQSGAGIVYDSNPTREWEESEHKARALVTTVQQQARKRDRTKTRNTTKPTRRATQ